jgi:hypothetical protein
MSGADFWKAFSTPFFLMVLFVIAIFGVVKIYSQFTTPPTIEVTSGTDIVTSQTEVPIAGVVKNAVVLRVNGQETPLDKSGNFSTMVPVVVGMNAVELVAGNAVQTRSTVSITREDTQPAVASSDTTATTNTSTIDLSNSGPVETGLGSFGLAAIIVSLMVLRRSKRENSLQKA